MHFKGKIYITTTGIMITPYTQHQSRYLEKMTSKYDEIYHKRVGITGFYINDDESSDPCYITHLFKPMFIQSLFMQYEIEYIPAIRGKKIKRTFSLNSDITPTDVQYNAIHDVINTYKNHNQWFIHLSQGLGKTLLSVYLISVFKVKSLIMCFSTEILKQWIKTIKKKTDMDVSRILLIDSSGILRAIHDNDFPVDDYDIFVCTPGILTGYGKKHGYSKLQSIFKKIGIGFKIFDEAHRNIANIVKINAFTSVDKTLYLSGDFGQSDKIKEKMYYTMFENVPIIRPSEEVMNTLKYTVAVVISYDSDPDVTSKTGVYVRRGFSFYEYMRYQFKTKIFFDVLFYTMDHIIRSNTGRYKTLILVNLVEHCDDLYDLVKDKYGDKFTVGKFHGTVSDEDKDFSREHADFIIATYQSFSTGIDVSDIKYVVSTSVCTKIDDNQASGRARPLSDGSDAYYFMFCDIGFSYSNKKLNERINYLYDTKIKDVKRLNYI